MNSKARITYRFDKQDGSRTEQKPSETERSNKSNVVPFFQEEMKFTSEIGAWNSPFQNDAHALEQLIRDTDRKPQSKPSTINPPTAAIPSNPKPLNRETSHPHTQLREEEWNDHIQLGDERDIRDTIIHTQAYPIVDINEDERYEMDSTDVRTSKGLGAFKTATNYRPSRGPSWYKVFASVTAAIVTGALFGYFVLALFTSNSATTPSNPAESKLGDSITNPGGTATTTKDGASSTVTGAAANKTNSDNSVGVTGTDSSTNTKSGSASLIKVQVPSVTYYMLQYGVFSNKEGLTAAVNELNNKGLAAASLTTPDDYRVYVGMSTERNEVQALGQTLTDMDVYVKQIDLPALSQLAFTGNKKTVESFFDQTAALIKQLDTMTLSGLNTTGTAINSNWTDLHQKWTKSATQVEAGLVNKADKTALLKLEQLINTAVVAASEYAKKPANAHLWSMQTALMEAIFTQKVWFVSMDAL
ncbi:hypothetical protein Back11_05920 [Paenibacillus baekrokdamisoli]|uniref:Uncharacterized protein n=1 Tax=Paenibacillus baekrokdamisoli TaxID=1712516 RepID=A0A3G9IJR6_9BACL|nr:SPOR domain-containing protein [Paenibacillus baekrokdamisoli]MBB3067568.1 hypothetical protein [Paenibacillus baekrokdamisoli]BBH19247.1 hypothetical protein Back11_05920 [Paenibacillus baekrokdamisoli]